MIKKTLWHHFMDGVQLPQGQSHFEEAIHFLPLSSQKFLVLTLSTLEGWKAESTLKPPTGFECETSGLGMPQKILPQLSNEIRMSQNIVLNRTIRFFSFSHICIFVFLIPCRSILRTHFFIETSKLLQIYTLKNSFFYQIKMIRIIVFALK